MTPAKASPWGVYVHFPWCLKKCPYCDFLSLPVEPQRLLRLEPKPGANRTSQGEAPQSPPDSAEDPDTTYGSRRTEPPAPLDSAQARRVLPHAAYADAVLRELEERAPSLGTRPPPSSLFFGGGTPSLWQPEELGRVISAVSDRKRWSPTLEAPSEELEITVECNPTSFDEDQARSLLDVGVNRISLGVQSLDAGRLDFLGRLHDASGAFRALEAAQRAGVPRISADLIFGVAGQSPEAAAREVQRVAETGLTHLSAYALTIESNTHFGVLASRGELPKLDDDLVAESFLAVEETLTHAGFSHYEVSNYARKGHTSRHNLGYWRGHDYLGLGVGAWGTVQLQDTTRLRYRNTVSVERYLTGWMSSAPDPFGAGPLLSEREPIDGETALRERLLLGLRLDEGVDVDEAAAALGVPAWPRERLRAKRKLLANGRLEEEGTRLKIPRHNWLFADGIIAELI